MRPQQRCRAAICTVSYLRSFVTHTCVCVTHDASHGRLKVSLQVHGTHQPSGSGGRPAATAVAGLEAGADSGPPSCILRALTALAETCLVHSMTRGLHLGPRIHQQALNQSTQADEGLGRWVGVGGWRYEHTQPWPHLQDGALSFGAAQSSACAVRAAFPGAGVAFAWQAARSSTIDCCQKKHGWWRQQPC